MLMWNSVRDRLLAHFRTASRREAIGGLLKMSNFCEGWFTAETRIAVAQLTPTIQPLSNTNYKSFQKPDIVIEDGDFAAVVALKHIATLNPDAASRWDGGKGSTVAKDILKFQGERDSEVVRKVLVFYGPAAMSAHASGGSCRTNRATCVDCSLRHLSDTLRADGINPGGSVVFPLLEPTFHLIEFEPRQAAQPPLQPTSGAPLGELN